MEHSMSEPYPSELGRRIQQLRTERHLSQEALAAELGISRQAVAKWECGQSVPSTANLLALAQLFSVPLEALTGGTSRPAPAGTQRPKRIAFRILCLLGVLSFACTLLLWRLEAASQLPTGIIGGADGPTQNLVTGSSPFPWIFSGITLLLTLAAVIVRRRQRRRRDDGR